MIEKIRALVIKHWDIVSYLFFGVLTTVVGIGVIWLASDCLEKIALAEDIAWLKEYGGAVSNTISWIVAVAFAYLTNKPFVFKSHDWSAKTVLPELGKFVGGRATSWVVETLLIHLTVDVYGGNIVFWKLITGVLVVIMNYIVSKLLVFRK